MAEANVANPELLDEAPTEKQIPIDLFLLWRSRVREDLTIQISFGKEVKFNFEFVERLSDGTDQDQNPCVYRIRLNLMKNSDGELTIEHKKQLLKAQQYQLLLKNKGYLSTSFYPENIFRKFENIAESSQFLFNVVFAQSPPGKFTMR